MRVRRNTGSIIFVSSARGQETSLHLLEGSWCPGGAGGGDGQALCIVGFRAGEHSDIYKCMVNGTRRSSGIASLLGFA